MNSCILCGEMFGNNPNPAMVCPECKEAFLNWKTTYYTTKKLTETTDLDETVFEEICEQFGVSEMVKNEISGLFPSDLDEILYVAKEICEAAKNKVPWLTQQEGRYEKFLEYFKDRIRKEYKKQTRQL